MAEKSVMTWLVLFFSQNAQKLRFTGLSSLKNGIRFKNDAATGSGSPSAGKHPCPAAAIRRASSALSAKRKLPEKPSSSR